MEILVSWRGVRGFSGRELKDKKTWIVRKIIFYELYLAYLVCMFSVVLVFQVYEFFAAKL